MHCGISDSHRENEVTRFRTKLGVEKGGARGSELRAMATTSCWLCYGSLMGFGYPAIMGLGSGSIVYCFLMAL